MKVLARVLLGLGTFLLIAGILAVTYAPGVVKKTPLDVDTDDRLRGRGGQDRPAHRRLRHEAGLRDPADQGGLEKSERRPRHLVEEPACAVFDTGGAQECVNGNDPDLITASIDIFATTASPPRRSRTRTCPRTRSTTRASINKFPFDVEKKTYPFWDGDIGRAVDIDYKGTETLFGLETYEFSYTVTDEPIDVAEGIPGTYDNVVTVYVDPKTGSIVKSGQDQQRFLEDGTPVLDIQLSAPTTRSRRPSTRPRPPAGRSSSCSPSFRSSASVAASCACSEGSS